MGIDLVFKNPFKPLYDAVEKSEYGAIQENVCEAFYQH